MNVILYKGEQAHKTKYDGYYCTKSGKVITVKVKGGRGKIDYSKPRELPFKEDKDGYYQVTISLKNDPNYGKNIYPKVHRLVYETFNGDILNDLTVDHIDNNCKNNRLDNLQLLTREENAVRRSNDWAKLRENKYIVYDSDMNIIISDVNKKYLEDTYGIKNHDIHRYVNKNLVNDKMLKLGIVIRKM